MVPKAEEYRLDRPSVYGIYLQMHRGSPTRFTCMPDHQWARPFLMTSPPSENHGDVVTASRLFTSSQFQRGLDSRG